MADTTDSDSPRSPISHSRRSLIAGFAGLVGAATAAGMTLATAAEPAVAVDTDPAALEVGGDPTVTSNDGRIEAVYLSPELSVSWEDFGEGVEMLEVTLGVGGPAGVDEMYRETLSDADPETTPGDVREVSGDEFGTTHGDLTVALDRADATARGDAVTSDALSDGDLSGGETASTTLDVVSAVTVAGGDDEASATRTATVEVAVTNPEGTVDAGGEVVVDAA
ncbi:hypothetical protein JCM17823_21790 [Halorubrum gandharaense]